MSEPRSLAKVREEWLDTFAGRFASQEAMARFVTLTAELDEAHDRERDREDETQRARHERMRDGDYREEPSE